MRFVERLRPDRVCTFACPAHSEKQVLGFLRELIIDSLVRPQEAARKVLGLRAPFGVLLEAALVVTCVGMILTFVALQFSPGALDPASARILSNPLIGALLQLGILAIAVLFIVHAGRFFGGNGGVDGALAVVVWLDFMMLIVQAVQIVSLVIFPPIATFLSIVAVLWVLWAAACFICELHEFKNPVVVLGGVIAGMAMLFFGMAILLAALGAPLQGAG